MARPAHIPGPYRLEVPPSSAFCLRYVVADHPNGDRRDPVIAEVRDQISIPQADVLATAQLFAEAPALLAALKALLDWGREHTSPLDANSPHALLVAADAAVRRAEEGREPAPAARPQARQEG